ncbi:MAG: undecaprenyl-diphosphate phosphatase [Gammaproteobacteria bacterium]|nr:undecaprenyl-diphosphate phosphatase [Gammaproteobacteria bacterium]
MDIFQTITLALIQGLTEFLPISSSAHLLFPSELLNWPDQGLAFDVVLHLGTLSAIVYYYRCSLLSMSNDFFHSFNTRQLTADAKLAWGVLLGTIPVGLVGLLFKDFIQLNLRSIEVVAYSTLFFGLLLGFADWVHRRKDKFKEIISWSDVAIIGIFQAIALVPGTSRSGITITAALLLGLSYKLSLKFAFLLSIPVIILSTLLMSIDLASSDNSIDWLSLLLGFVISAIAAYATIAMFIRLVDKVGMLPFVLYRLLLGGLLCLL